jgi:hypothetical protein
MTNELQNMVESIHAVCASSHVALKQSLSLLQSDITFSLRVQKTAKRDRIVSANIPLKRLVLTRATFSQFDPELTDLDVEFVEGDFLKVTSDSEIFAKAEFLKGSIFLFRNPDIEVNEPESWLLKLLKLYQLSTDCVFLGWDWDNHHQLYTSMVMGACSDIYCPGNFANEYEVGACVAFKRHTPLSTIQWSRKFLAANIDLILRADRSDEVYGKFGNYGMFPFRNRSIHTLGQVFPQVQLNDFSFGTYVDRSQLSRLDEWSKHKVHWVVPTLSDVPCRPFDAWITGGLVVMPEAYRVLPVFQKLDARDVVFYRDQDLLNPVPLAQEAIQKFDHSGMDGVLRRHRFAVDHHNIDSRVTEMLEHVRKIYQ